MTAWCRQVEHTAGRHPWRFAALSALLLSAFASGLSLLSHRSALEVLVQLLIWGPGWFVLSGITGRLQRVRR